MKAPVVVAYPGATLLIVQKSMDRLLDSSAEQKRLQKKEYLRQYQIKHRDRLTEQSRAWRLKHRSIYLIRACFRRKWKHYAYPEESHKIERTHHLKKKFGMTVEEYQALFASQNGVCAICGNPETRPTLNRYLSIDHEHGTKPIKVRGLLCHSCNTALGSAHDSIEILQGMIEYLRKHSR